MGRKVNVAATGIVFIIEILPELTRPIVSLHEFTYLMEEAGYVVEKTKARI